MPKSPRTSTSPPSARASGLISSAARSQMPRRSTLHRTAHHSAAALETFLDHVEQRLLVRGETVSRAARLSADRGEVRRAKRLGQPQHAAAGRIQDTDLPLEADDEQTGGQARDDLA